MSERDLLNLSVLDLPTVVLFADYESLKSFYESFYSELRAAGNVFALGFNGGPNKLLGNFILKRQSILIATVEFLAKHAAKQLSPASLIFASLPGIEHSEHPYLKALGKQFPGGEAAFDALLFKEQLHKVMQCTFSPTLRNVYMFGATDELSSLVIEKSLALSPYFK